MRATKVPNLQIASSVEQEVGGFEVSVKHVSTVYILEPSQYLIEEIADMVVAQCLSLRYL